MLYIFCTYFFFLTTLLNAFPCVFCEKGKAREIQTFYENELVVGMLTHMPLYKYHVLVVPKRHVKRLEQLTSEEMGAIFLLMQKIQKHIFQKNGLMDYFVLQKNGKSAGQTVEHLHFHLIPVPKDTGSCSILWRFFYNLFSSPLKEHVLREKTAFFSAQMQEPHLE